jgi:hypothetical protein
MTDIVLPGNGIVADGIADDTQALHNLRDYAASRTRQVRITAVDGIYTYVESPNWAISNLDFQGTGMAALYHKGTTGPAVRIEVPAEGTVNTKMRGFRVSTSSPSSGGVAARGVHHGELGFNVRGCAFAAFKIAFCVLSDLRLKVSNNDGPWNFGNAPALGLLVDEDTSACNFHLIIEGVKDGADFRSAMGNNLWGGTIEGCRDKALYFGPKSRLNKTWGMYFEENGLWDVFFDGYNNRLIECESMSRVEFAPGAKRNKIRGGTYNDIHIYAETTDASVTDTDYGLYGGRITDFSNSTYRRGNLNIKTGERD